MAGLGRLGSRAWASYYVTISWCPLPHHLRTTNLAPGSSSILKFPKKKPKLTDLVNVKRNLNLTYLINGVLYRNVPKYKFVSSNVD